MKKEGNYKLFWRILLILFIIFLALYIAVESGYNDVVTANKTVMTEQKLREFERDVKENKEIDIKDYLEYEHNNYSSQFSNLGVTLSKRMKKTLNGSIETSINIIKKLFT